MKSSKQWLPVIVGLIATPLTLLLALSSAGAGHGDYFWAKVFYPYTILSAIALKSITIPFMVVAVLELPAYGVLLGTGWSRGKLKLYSMGLFFLHISAVIICFAIRSENFS
jgi:hypothetical protein